MRFQPSPAEASPPADHSAQARPHCICPAEPPSLPWGTQRISLHTAEGDDKRHLAHSAVLCQGRVLDEPLPETILGHLPVFPLPNKRLYMVNADIGEASVKGNRTFLPDSGRVTRSSCCSRRCPHQCEHNQKGPRSLGEHGSQAEVGRPVQGRKTELYNPKTI